jgi:hypothetical protein
VIIATSPLSSRRCTRSVREPRLVANQAWAALGPRGPDRRASLPVHLEVVSRVWRLRTDSWTPRRRGAHLKAVEGGQKLKPSDSTDGIPSSPGGLAAGPEEGSRPYRENASGLSFGPSRPDSRLSAHVPIMPITREQPSSGLPECRSAGFERRVGS